MAMKPAIERLLETALFISDPTASKVFYGDVLGLECLVSDSRGCVFELPGRQILLLIKEGVTEQPNPTPGGMVPTCGAQGRSHLAFAAPADDLQRWRDHLRANQVEVESEVSWERGGRSLYFRDPDKHLLELATPGIWQIY